MKIETISIVNEGYVHCNSCFYSSHDSLSGDSKYNFFTGTNKVVGEIDSGAWAVSYLLSMYQFRPKDFTLFGIPEAIINNTIIPLDALCQYSCYMDKLYPLFSTNRSIKQLVLKGLRHHHLEYSVNDIKDLFHLDSERFERSLTGVGNEVFRAMAAIGYCHGKQIFCFPWLSQKRFDSYHNHMTDLLNILDDLNGMVILPVGQ